MKYIVVTGGVISGIGKGITSCSIGVLFKALGYTVTMIKIDPYLNVDAGTMSPYEHGECFVLSDGGECDLDLGNYERFLRTELTRDHNITTGRIYQSVIEKERRGDYLGATVQIVPHITDEIISHISNVSVLPVGERTPDICIIEIGGTVGDIEGLPFIEALQQMRGVTEDEFCFVHVAMAVNVPELKTKPIQHSIAALRSRGIFPDLLVVRSKEKLEEEVKSKLHRLCQISPHDIISNPDVPTIYHVSEVFSQQRICQRIGRVIGITTTPLICDGPHSDIVAYYDKQTSLKEVNIGIVGKYTGSPDTYLSLVRAIEHASFHLNVRTNVTWISSDHEDMASKTFDNLSRCDGFIIPGGFGSRGIPGKLAVARFARENNIPILGICLGMQVMIVDSLKYIGLHATSREWDDLPCDETTRFAIDLLPGQTNTKGGTMRLGNYITTLTSQTLRDMYKSENVIERHRHRYEVNNSFIQDINLSGLHISGQTPCGSPPANAGIGTDSNNLVEIIELKDHPFYIGCQFHPEFRSYPDKPHPLFVGLLRTCI